MALSKKAKTKFLEKQKIGQITQKVRANTKIWAVGTMKVMTNGWFFRLLTKQVTSVSIARYLSQLPCFYKQQYAQVIGRNMVMTDSKRDSMWTISLLWSPFVWAVLSFAIVRSGMLGRLWGAHTRSRAMRSPMFYREKACFTETVFRIT